jgi:hypothetical protein
MTSTDTEDVALEIPKIYKHHAFACYTQRPPGHPRGSCGALGAQPLWALRQFSHVPIPARTTYYIK